MGTEQQVQQPRKPLGQESKQIYRRHLILLIILVLILIVGITLFQLINMHLLQGAIFNFLSIIFVVIGTFFSVIFLTVLPAISTNLELIKSFLFSSSNKSDLLTSPSPAPSSIHTSINLPSSIETDISSLPQKTKEQLLNEGAIFLEREEYEEALNVYVLASKIEPSNTAIYNGKGNALCRLMRYEEALAAYKQAIRIDPNNSSAYNGKGNALYGLKRYEEALTSCEQALQLSPGDAEAFKNKGNILYELKLYKEALTAYYQALRLNPNNAIVYNNKGNTLFKLRYYKAALAACERAIQLGPINMAFYKNKTKIQRRLDFYNLCKRQVLAFFILLFIIVSYEAFFYIDLFRSIRGDGSINGGDLFNFLFFFQTPVAILALISFAYFLIVWLIIMKIKPLKPEEDYLVYL